MLKLIPLLLLLACLVLLGIRVVRADDHEASNGALPRVCRVHPSADGVSDDAPAILQAFKDCGQDGHIIFDDALFHVESVLQTTGLCNVVIDLPGTLLVRFLFLSYEHYSHSGSGERISLIGEQMVLTLGIKTKQLRGCLVVTELHSTGMETALSMETANYGAYSSSVRFYKGSVQSSRSTHQPYDYEHHQFDIYGHAICTVTVLDYGHQKLGGRSP
ncbi:hypothetical protein C0991_001298 [Blastosporella zonata]|nr:hypothetical protein C0991_001298 [Blastosporella zonata]